MNSKPVLQVTLLTALISMSIMAHSETSVSPGLSERLIKQLPPDKEVVATKSHVVGGKGFTFVKLLGEDGEVTSMVFNPAGKPIPEQAVPAVKASKIGGRLREILALKPGQDGYVTDDADIEVYIGFREPVVDSTQTESYGEASIVNGFSVVTVDGERVTEEELDAYNERKANEIAVRGKSRAESRKETIRELAVRNGWENRPPVVTAIERGESSVHLQMKKGFIRSFVTLNEDLVDGIELYDEPQDNLDSAMLATRVDPHALNYPTRRGNGVGIYMSESGCPMALKPGNEDHISNYVRISGASTAHSKNVSAIIRGISPESYLFCEAGFKLPSLYTLLSAALQSRPIHIQNHSWGVRRDDDKFYKLKDRDFDNYVLNWDSAIFTAAGNSGKLSGFVSSPGKALNVITVGNYRDSDNNINPGSSFLDPETKNSKPEIVAPGTSICAGGSCKTGTSMASPHAVGIAADLMSSRSLFKYRPSLLKALMLANAGDEIGGGYDKVGLGGIDAYNVFYGNRDWYFEGDKNIFAKYDAIDPLPNNGYIERQVYLSGSYSKVRAALSWLTSGTWTYNNRTNPHPIGMDLDLMVVDPNGRYIGFSFSYDNPFEVIEFDPQVSGIYTFKINDYSKRDSTQGYNMGLSVSWL